MRLFHSPPVRRRGWAGSATWLVWIAANLWLGTKIVGADKTAADYFVHSLPGQPDGPLLKMHAGHVEVDSENNGNLFFWHFQNRHIANRQRTVIWLNGGPGCSSMDGALMEIGPYRLKDDAHLEYNDGSWDEFANLLFVDQPVGTGFSYVNTNRYLHELPEMARHFIVFLEKWFAMFPDYEHDDIYIAGESYAGQHIPYITQAILDRNKEPGKHVWNVKGLLMGNAWIDPVPQYIAYLSFAYKAGLVQGGTDIARELEADQARCLAELNKPGGSDHVDLPECEKVLQQILRLTSPSFPKIDDKPQCYNMYDVRLQDEYSSCGMNWPPDLTNVTPYLRRPDVVAALHVNKDKRTGWTECSGAVGSAFRARNSKPSIHLVPPILEAGIPIILFSGDKDLICNHIGTEEIIKSMSWSGGRGFELEQGVVAPRRDWVFEGEAAGFYQEARNLTYILFYNSSHMVPFDYPRRTRDMLDRFIGVDIASIGGKPADSRIDGEKAGLETSVGGHPNSTLATEAEKERLKQAEWRAYYKSGEAALVVVVIAASAWGWFVWRDRRKRRGYKGLGGLGNGHAGMNGGGNDGLEGFRRKRTTNGDVEAGDFDESELDELHVDPARGSRDGDMARERYSVGGVSDDESEDDGMATPKAKG